MRAVRSKNTTPELFVRRLLHHNGYRYRLHRSDLAGKPDIVFPARRKLIFVNGCFWHGHSCARGKRQPKTNADYWIDKIGGNVKRDRQNLEMLQRDGWDIMTVWECETRIKVRASLLQRIQEFLRE